MKEAGVEAAILRMVPAAVVAIAPSSKVVDALLGDEELHSNALDDQIVPSLRENHARLVDVLEQPLHVWSQEARDVRHKEVVVCSRRRAISGYYYSQTGLLEIAGESLARTLRRPQKPNASPQFP